MTNDILELIPQRPPFVLVDGFNNVKRSSTFTVPANHILVENGQLLEAGIVEHMAQSIAVLFAKEAQMNGHNVDVRVGVIGALKKIKIHHQPNVGDTLMSHMLKSHEVLQAQIVTIQTLVNNQIISEGELTIFKQ
jgi:3-hydroxyacyl-[acyl-carrier-protein] dehydratase